MGEEENKPVTFAQMVSRAFYVDPVPESEKSVVDDAIRSLSKDQIRVLEALKTYLASSQGIDGQQLQVARWMSLMRLLAQSFRKMLLLWVLRLCGVFLSGSRIGRNSLLNIISNKVYSSPSGNIFAARSASLKGTSSTIVAWVS